MIKFNMDIVKQYEHITDKNDRKYYNVSDVLKMCKDLAKNMKFDASLEAYITLGIDPKHANQNLRFMANIKNGTGKNTQKIAVISANQADIDAAKAAGAHIAGGQEIIDDIKAGRIDFNLVITTPQSMPLLSQVAMILGKKGLMPNPKLGRVTTNVAQAVQNAQNQIEIRADKLGIVRAGIGKMSFDLDKLEENVRNLIKDINTNKPSGAKGKYFREVFLSFTMGPSFRINMANLEV